MKHTIRTLAALLLALAMAFAAVLFATADETAAAASAALEENLAAPAEEQAAEPAPAEEKAAEPAPAEEKAAEPAKAEKKAAKKPRDAKKSAAESEVFIIDDGGDEPFTGVASWSIHYDGEYLCYGDEVLLKCVCYNANKPYSVRWEMLDDLGGWVTIGEGEFCAFTVTRENADKFYRAVIIVK